MEEICYILSVYAWNGDDFVQAFRSIDDAILEMNRMVGDRAVNLKEYEYTVLVDRIGKNHVILFVPDTDIEYTFSVTKSTIR